MRVVLTHVYCWPEVRRGGERYLHELAAALRDAGHEVAVVSSAPVPWRNRELDVPVTRLKRRHLAPRRLDDLRDEASFAVQALAHLGARRFDVWHALGTADAAAAALLARARSIRPVYTNLGLPERAYRDGRPDRRLHDLVVASVDSYICLSAVGERMLRRDYGRAGHTVSGGVDCRRFVPAPARHERPALLFSGALTEPRKNMALLLDAFALVRERRADAELWLSGAGDPSVLVAAAPRRARDGVRLLGLGRPEDQIGRYGRAWATVLPSHHEAFGLVLIESLACGTPIVALDDGYGPSEIVEPGTGFLAAATPESLAAACEQALELTASAGTTDRCRSASWSYDWRRSIVPRIEELYSGEATLTGTPVGALI